MTFRGKVSKLILGVAAVGLLGGVITFAACTHKAYVYDIKLDTLSEVGADTSYVEWVRDANGRGMAAGAGLTVVSVFGGIGGYALGRKRE